MDQIDNIKKMEVIFDKARKNIDDLTENLQQYHNLQGEIEELVSYYQSEQWMKDYTDDEEGELPADLKRGVLSQDGVYDLLNDEKEMIAELLETVKSYLNK